MLRSLFAVWVCILCQLQLVAQNPSDLFVINRVTNHVYTIHPKTVNRVSTTSTVVVGENFLTVVEGQTDVAMGRELIKAIRTHISSLPVKYLVITHMHLDHILGAAAFLEDNPKLSIITHQNTATDIVASASEERASWSQYVQQKSQETLLLAAQAPSEISKKQLQGIAGELQQYADDVAASKIALPNLTFSDSLFIRDKELNIQLRYLGKGHTDGDIIVYLPSEKVLITGDLVHDLEPLFWHADIDSWIKLLDKIESIDFEYFVGGHGDANKGKEILRSWKGLIIELRKKTLKAMNKGMSLSDLQNSVTIDNLSALQNGYGKRITVARTNLMGDVLPGPLINSIQNALALMWKYYQNKLTRL